MLHQTGTEARVSSGKHATLNERGEMCNAVHQAAGRVDMSELNNVFHNVDAGVVTVGAGATSRTLTKAFAADKTPLLLLADSPDRSVASVVLSGSPGLAPRTFGRLRSRVRGLHVALNTGEVVYASGKDTASDDERQLFNRLMQPAANPEGIVTDFEFGMDTDDGNSWAERVCTLFTDKVRVPFTFFSAYSHCW
jgi:hypothetical protein